MHDVKNTETVCREIGKKRGELSILSASLTALNFFCVLIKNVHCKGLNQGKYMKFTKKKKKMCVYA